MSEDIINDALQSSVSYMTLQKFWDRYAIKNKITNSRLRENVMHRHAFSHAVRESTRMSLKKIGQIIGRDHASVIWGCKNHDANYRYDSDYRIIYHSISNEIKEILLDSGVVPKSIAETNDVKEVHFKFLALSRKLRSVTMELRDYKKEVQQEMKKVNIYKQEIASLTERNRNLDKELKRLKNLL